VALIAQLALYHRRGIPKRPPFPGLLKRADQARIARLGALLRLAEYLERSRTQVVPVAHLHTDTVRHYLAPLRASPAITTVSCSGASRRRTTSFICSGVSARM